MFLSSCCDGGKPRVSVRGSFRKEAQRTYRDEERVFAYPLHRLDQKRRQLRHGIEDMREFLQASPRQVSGGEKQEARGSQAHGEGSVLSDGEILRVGQIGAVRLVASKVVLL